MVNSGFILSAASTVLIATTDFTVLALAGAFGAGAAWVSVFASLSAGDAERGAGLGAGARRGDEHGGVRPASRSAA